MPLFSTGDRKPGLRFPMGTRGRTQSCLRLVGVPPEQVRLRTTVDPDQPLTSYEKLQQQMISNQQLIRDAIERTQNDKTEAAGTVEVSIT